MPTSLEEGKAEALGFIKGRFTNRFRILDVGPGAGVYGRRLLPWTDACDCVEIYKPYVEEFKLKSIYDKVWIEDVRQFTQYGLQSQYEIFILGDVLEHLTAKDAVKLIQDLRIHGTCVVSVPWLYRQGPVGGNEHEAHLQDDLTPEVMVSRFPMLRPLALGGRIGVYVSEWPERMKA